nr:hypothetical protein [Tanacetum cinerariifolium]
MEIIPNEEEVLINAIPLAVKSPKIVDWKIHKEGKKSYYQIIRADGNSKMYMVFIRMLKEFDREDLEELYSLNIKFRGGLLGLKVILMLLQLLLLIDVNTALMELVLLYKVNAAEELQLLEQNDELSDKELKQIETDDQATQTILLGLPEDIYAAEKKAKLFNEWERKAKRKDTQVPQLSGSIESVANEAVYKELDDSLVKATTTASSLKAEQDSGDTIAQTRSERQSKLSNDSLLARGRISDIDADEGITLVSTHDDVEMFDADKDLHGEEVVYNNNNNTKPKSQDKGKAIMIEEPVKLKKKDQIMLDEEVTLKLQAELQAEFDKEEQRLSRESAQKEQEVNKEQQELNDAEKAILFMQLLEKRRKFFAAKRAEEKRNKPPTRAQQRSIMVNTFVDYNTELVEESSKKAKAEVIEGSSKRAGTELEQESSKKQKIDDDKETAELK